MLLRSLRTALTITKYPQQLSFHARLAGHRFLRLLVHPYRMREVILGKWAFYSTIPMCSMRTLTYVRNRMERSKDHPICPRYETVSVLLQRLSFARNAKRLNFSTKRN